MLINSIPFTSVYAQQTAPQDLCDSYPGRSCIPGTPTGTDTFKSFMEEKERHGWTFVDKSLLIKEIIDSSDRAILITRPRRWGKSLNLSMLESFFKPELTKDGRRVSEYYRENLGIFEKLKISSGYIDTREIINRILLSQTIDRSFRDHHSTIFEIAQNQEFSNKASILQGHREGTLQDTSPLKNVIKSYGSALLGKLSGFDVLKDFLRELGQLYSQLKAVPEHEKRAVEAQYSEQFEAIRKQVETYIESNTDLKAELRKEFDLMGRHQGQHPTILLSLKEAKEDTYQSFENQLRLKIGQVFGGYPYILNGLYTQSRDDSDHPKKVTAEKNLRKFERLFKETSTVEDLKDSLRFLSELLYDYHGKKAYILIDEYDAAPNYLLFKDGTTREDILPVAKLISDILSPLCKGNEFVEKVILTGVFDTLYREAGSGINNVVPYSIMSPKYSDYYGFSETEIRQRFLTLLPQAQQDTLINQLKAWYDGYTDKHLYAPWPVVLHLSEVIESCKTQCNYALKPESYWNQSGASDALDKIANIFKKLSEVSQDDIDVNHFLFADHPYRDVKPSSLSRIFSREKSKAEIFRYMLINFGYLTTKNNAITIPNQEVKSLYKEHFENWVAVSKPPEFSRFVGSFAHSQRDFEALEVLLKDLKLENSLEKSSLEALHALRDHQRTKGVFDAIASGNLTSLQKALSGEEKVKCESSLFNFNFLHLAALSGKKDIFSTIEEYCGTSLLTSKDKQGLTPVDYAYLSSNQSSIVFSLKERQQEARLIYSPGLGSKFFCYATIPTGGALISQLLTPLVRMLFNAPPPPHAGGIQALFAPVNLKVMALGLGVGTYFKDSILSYLDFDVCKNYKNYHAINSISPKQYTSLKQFEKYRADHKSAYLALDTDCKFGRHKKVSTIKLHPFTYDEKNYSVTLCDLSENLKEGDL
jgi:hypothetical protein